MSHPVKPTDIGLNRTGVATSPIDSARMIAVSESYTPPTPTDGSAIAAERLVFSRTAPPVGTVPPPASVKGLLKVAVDLIKGTQPTVLLDKMGERLAFERTGTRLYEALLVKFAASDNPDPTVTRDAIASIRDDELRHVGLLGQAMVSLGADPTAMTPCADVVAVASLGLPQVLTDPRTTFSQALEAILIAELADNDGWAMLIMLAEAAGHEELAKEFRVAFGEEAEHLARVRQWLSRSITAQATLAEEQPAPTRP